MSEFLQLVKDLDAVGVAALILVLARYAINYLREQIGELRTERDDLVAELKAEREGRLKDKDTEADDRVANAARLEGVLREFTASTEANTVVLDRVARKLQVDR